VFGPRGKPDPLLTSTGWKRVRAHWIDQRLPCQAPRCVMSSRVIDYDGPYWLTVRGRKTINPWAFHCGHIVSRRTARQLGWPESEVNSVANTRPEHAQCSVKAGAREGRAVQSVTTTRRKLITSRQW
jgi:hypothetical protein